MAKSAKLRITRRVANVKRHTKGYVIGGKTFTVNSARKMAAQGRIAGVRVVGKHIQAVPGRRRLTDLPCTIQ